MLAYWINDGYSNEVLRGPRTTRQTRDVEPMWLVRCRRQWASVQTELVQCIVFVGM